MLKPATALIGAPKAAKAPRSLHAAMTLFMLVLFVLLTIASFQKFRATGTLKSFGILAVNTLFVVLYLSRRPARTESDSPAIWALAFAGSTLPLLMRSSEGSGFEQAGAVVQLAGFVLLAGALLCLRRSFAVVPANRGIRDGGLYRVVRHPVYLAELLVFLGVVLANPTVLNVIIWVCECGLQFARACAEEQLLCSDPAYRAYRRRVRYRLIPGLV